MDSVLDHRNLQVLGDVCHGKDLGDRQERVDVVLLKRTGLS